MPRPCVLPPTQVHLRGPLANHIAGLAGGAPSAVVLRWIRGSLAYIHCDRHSALVEARQRPPSNALPQGQNTQEVNMHAGPE